MREDGWYWVARNYEWLPAIWKNEPDPKPWRTSCWRVFGDGHYVCHDKDLQKIGLKIEQPEELS